MLQRIASILRQSLVLSVTAVLTACAVLHKVQLAEVDGRKLSNAKKITVRVSETTVDVGEAAQLAKMANTKASNSLAKAADYYKMFFQLGPATGTPVYNEFYARNIPEALMRKCPGGHVTDIISVRETREYPVIKGEIVRIDALCVPGKKKRAS